jgi:Kef-type K+ transport system membrane component KefB
MEQIFTVAAVWLLLAVVAAIIAYHLKISIALVEICVGVVAASVANEIGIKEELAANSEWLKFLASSGALLLTFLAGAELQPDVIKQKIKEVSAVGIIGFLAPFIGGVLVSFYLLDWSFKASLIVGIALSTTSMAVVYAVMLETGLNKTDFGKGILGACFINDLGTVISLALMFAPFTYRTLVFISITVFFLFALPSLSKLLTRIYGHKTAAIRTKWVIAVLFALGAFALWAGSEAVLPAYLVGMVLAEFSSDDLMWVRRFRTLTVGFLTPFYFLRAGTFVSLTSLVAQPVIFLALFFSKVLSKIFGLYPVISAFREKKDERWYYSLMMSTGLTFGTISALYGFTHQIISQEQYSFIVAVVIGSAVIPTMIANMSFLPKHLIPAQPILPNIEEEEEGEEG